MLQIRALLCSNWQTRGWCVVSGSPVCKFEDVHGRARARKLLLERNSCKVFN